MMYNAYHIKTRHASGRRLLGLLGSAVEAVIAVFDQAESGRGLPGEPEEASIIDVCLCYGLCCVAHEARACFCRAWRDTCGAASRKHPGARVRGPPLAGAGAPLPTAALLRGAAPRSMGQPSTSSSAHGPCAVLPGAAAASSAAASWSSAIASFCTVSCRCRRSSASSCSSCHTREIGTTSASQSPPAISVGPHRGWPSAAGPPATAPPRVRQLPAAASASGPSWTVCPRAVDDPRRRRRSERKTAMDRERRKE